MPARVFVGQRKDPFAVNLGTIFDLVNAPVGVITDPALIGAVPNTIDDKNVTTLALEVHKSCLTAGDEPVIGGWTTRQPAPGAPARPDAQARPPDHREGRRRLDPGLAPGHAAGQRGRDRPQGQGPLQRLASRKDDGQFADYVTNPTLPALLEIALGAAGHRADQLPAHRPGHRPS